MDRYLKQLGTGWTKADDGSFRYKMDEVEGQPAESLKIVKADKGWVIVLLVNGQGNMGHFYPSFKQVVQSLKS